MELKGRERRRLATGLLFLLPNILGFLAFTVIPLGFSMVLAFSNWDLKLHNIFKDEQIKFVGFENFRHLSTHHDFYRFLGNTLFFMMGIPFSIAGSLFLATLLTKEMQGENRRTFLMLIMSAVFLASTAVLLVFGLGQTAMVILFTSVAGGMLVLGTLGGSTVYRAFFYVPAFTAGVPVYILWKKLYAPHTGPVNNALRPVLEPLTAYVRNSPEWLVEGAAWVCICLVGVCLYAALGRLRNQWANGELGSWAVVIAVLPTALPLVLMQWWFHKPSVRVVLAVVGTAALAVQAIRAGIQKRPFACPGLSGLGDEFVIAAAGMVLQFLLIGGGLILFRLPEMAGSPDGLRPPEWLTNYDWAKPAIMIMGFWASVGSANMLLYIAALSNIPAELYEAADMDGASSWQRFWNVIRPQLAPTTFFIVIMSVIHGMQGGFEMARTMTRGGPAGATTTLSYFIYIEGFETGRLGFASAVAWTLFLMVLVLTLFNWKVGNRYVNE